MPRAFPLLHSFFYRFLIGLCSVFRSLEPQNLSKLYSFSIVFLLFGLCKITSSFYTFLIQHGWIFGAKNHQKTEKKTIPRGIIKLINFGTDFSSMFAAFWKPSWTHVGHLSRPKTAQEVSKTVSGRLQDDAKNAPRSNTTWARDQNKDTPSVRRGIPHQPR